MACTEWKLEDTDPELAEQVRKAQNIVLNEWLETNPVWQKFLKETFFQPGWDE